MASSEGITYISSATDITGRQDAYPAQGWTARLWAVVTWSFVIVFAMVLAAAFGLALSRLDDAAVLCVGVAALAAGVVGVGLQGMYVSSQQEYKGFADPGNLLGRDAGADVRPIDRFAVQAYTLNVCPTIMASLKAAFSPAALVSNGVRFTDSGLVTCTIPPTTGSGTSMSTYQTRLVDLDYTSALEYLVVAKGLTSDALRMDVSQGFTTSILVAGGFRRIMPLTEIDFETSSSDTRFSDIVKLATHDVYAVFLRGAGSHADATCPLAIQHLPWGTDSGQALSTVINAATSPESVTMYAWGFGGRGR